MNEMASYKKSQLTLESMKKSNRKKMASITKKPRTTIKERAAAKVERKVKQEKEG